MEGRGAALLDPSEVTSGVGVQEDATAKPCFPRDPELSEVHGLIASVLRKNQVEWVEDAQRYLSLLPNLREVVLRSHIPPRRRGFPKPIFRLL